MFIIIIIIDRFSHLDAFLFSRSRESLPSISCLVISVAICSLYNDYLLITSMKSDSKQFCSSPLRLHAFIPSFDRLPGGRSRSSCSNMFPQFIIDQRRATHTHTYETKYTRIVFIFLYKGQHREAVLPHS